MESPEEIYRVSQSQFSIARHYGGVQFNGKYYVYDPARDVLIRRDVLAAREKAAREEKSRTEAEKRQAAKTAQGSLF